MSATTSRAVGDLAFVGDVHLDRADPALEPFLCFLDRLGESASRLVLMGDLFNLWIGRRELEQPHQQAVLEKLAALRRRGLVVRYLEGNRDYRIGPCYHGSALDDASSDGIVERFAGHRLFAVHGDMVNPEDRSYRAWRRISRSAAVWRLFNLLPRSRRLRIAESLESRLRRANQAFKAEFPEALVRGYAEPRLAQGNDAVVLGHFHLERELESASGRIFVLPEWRESRRHLVVGWDGTIRFVSSAG